MLTKEQNEARRSAIGGSDWASVLNLPPYSCARSLWYEKTGQEPDYERADNPLFDRGSKLEPIIIKMYREKTNRLVLDVVNEINHPVADIAPWWRVNADGVIEDVPQDDPMFGRGPGYYEAKTMNREIYYRCRRDGLPEGYIMQNQAGIARFDLQWGSFAILWPDGWRLIHFDIERDDEMIALMKTAGDKFWRMVENGPPPEQLDLNDKRCSKCEFRNTCWGEKLLERVPDDGSDVPYDAGLSPLLAKLVEYEEIKEELDDLIATQKKKITEMMGDKPVVETMGFRCHHKSQKRNTFQTRKFRQDHPKMADEYTKAIITKPSFRKFSI